MSPVSRPAPDPRSCHEICHPAHRTQEYPRPAHRCRGRLRPAQRSRVILRQRGQRLARPAAPGRHDAASEALRRDHRQTHPRTTLADPSGYGLGVTQQTGTIWDYEGETFGYRVVHYYFPRSGMIIALAVNSATGNDDIADLAGSVYQTLEYV